MVKYLSIITLTILFTIYPLLSSTNENRNKDFPANNNSITNRVNNADIMGVEQLKRGMKGYGLSVFSGITPTRFNVEIIGVLKNEGPKSSLILARFSGNVMNHTGVIAGMSGSPVYINNKLIGAVSHAFPWSKDPIGAIRPIKEMLAVLEKRNYKPKDEPIYFIPLESTLRKKLEAHAPEYYKRIPSDTRIAYVNNQQMTLVPVKTPILFSGISNKVLDIIRKDLESYGLVAINNGSGGRITLDKNIPRELNPGDAVGIPLITGDMSATPVGTVTYRKGKDILIFGHPSFFMGPIDMPMSKEYIHTVIPSRQVSFKLASTLFEVGRVFDDRNTAVAGELGVFSKTVPVKVHIKNEGRIEDFNFKIVKDKVFFPNLLVTSIIQSVLNVNSQNSLSSIQFKFNIKVKNLKTGQIDTITTDDFLTGNETQKNLFYGLFRLTMPLQALFYNPFAKVEILRIDAHIDISHGWRASEIIRVKVLKNNIEPGDTVPALIILKNYKGELHYKKVSIKIPNIIRSKYIALGVGSAKIELTLDKAFSLAKFVPRNYQHLIKILSRNERFNDLAVWIDVPEQGLVINGHEHPNLPSSMLSIMRNANELGDKPIYGRIRKYYRTNYFIYGMKVIFLQINHNVLKK